jgi:hypothetical protein
MLNDKDKKYLSGAPRHLYLLSMTTLITVKLIFAAACIHNLYLTKITGSIEGYGIADIASLWARGADLEETYSGVYVTAINRFESALIDLGIVAILAISVWITHALRQRKLRIVQTLKDCGDW